MAKNIGNQTNISELGNVEAVDVEALRMATAQGAMDQGSEKLRKAELSHIQKRRRNARPDNLTGLALSGGGIRSATFSLGVMQALAHNGWLSKIDYLSTVSGGGYIGSAITWLTSKEAEKQYKGGPEADLELQFGTDRGNFPFGIDDPDKPESQPNDRSSQKQTLNYLRHHGSYLTPGAGISGVSLLGIVLRGMLLNLLVWLPIFVLVMMLLLKLPAWLNGTNSSQMPLNQESSNRISESKSITNISRNVLEALKPELDCGNRTLPSTDQRLTPPQVETLCPKLKAQESINEVLAKSQQLLIFEWLILATGVTSILLVIGTLVYSILTWIRRGNSPKWRKRWYSARRWAEKAVAILLPAAVLTLVIGTLPLVAAFLHSWLVATGPAAVIVGITVAMRSFLSSGKSGKGAPIGIVVTIAAGLFLYGVFLIAYQIAFFILFKSGTVHVAVYSLVAIPIIFGLLVNLNYISIHRYYRDRLMETFMPDITHALANETSAAQGADGAFLHEFADAEVTRSPYHIVNTNLVLVNSKVQTYKVRGGDNFILSPLYCGSNATGWCSSKEFMDGRMTLATAIAISGAAANPNTGVGGAGLTRNRFLSLVMSLLNLRLGYWAANPHEKHRPRHKPNHFRPGAYSVGNAIGILGFTEKRPFLQLSDGGHFENMAVYELARRRLKLIIVCDGGGDPEFSFSDFQTTLQRIQDDFGTRVEFDKEYGPERLVPTKPADYPMEGTFADWGHMLGTLYYADGSKGRLIFLKTTFIKEVSFEVKGYRALNPDFPDQSTADQFFDPIQFEAYRKLGYRIAEQAMGDKNVSVNISQL